MASPIQLPWLRVGGMAVSLAAIGLLLYLLDSGFCFTEWRYLTDRELIAKAVRDNASELAIDGSTESINRYLAEHPGCCGVDRHPTSRSLLDLCVGNNYAEVMINYRQRKPDDASTPFYEGYFGVDACATRSQPVYGMSF